MECGEAHADGPGSNGNTRLFFDPETQNCVFPNTVKCVEVHSTCFKARGNNPGRFPVKAGYITDIEITRRNGSVTCNKNRERNFSYWGCPKIAPGRLSIFIVDDEKEHIFPSQDVVLYKRSFYRLKDPSDSSGRTYYRPRSPSLMLGFGDKPKHVASPTTYTIWYGQDLFNLSAQNNRGKVCVDIEVRYR